MDTLTALLILAAITPYLIWLIRYITRSRAHVANREELNSTVDSSASDSGSAPSPTPNTKYDVFLSFRGEDTRDNFTSHLYDKLCKAKINTYIDYRLDKGGEISPSLVKAIEESRICVVIFSKDYASSTWCLDELVKMLECKERDGRIVIPVFYNIDPSNVRKQSGSYANAFLRHERRFKGNKVKLQRWKDALFQASNLSGWDSTKTRPESELVTKIIEDILTKLICASPCNFEDLVCIDNHIKNMETLLSIGSSDVRIVGIWGMGGIGKTTIADVMFQKHKNQFESSSFVRNVREQIERNGLENLQDKCLSQLLEDEDFSMHSIRSTFVKNRLQSKKILLVLDDVDNSIRANDLIKASHWFGQGSRVIITSRDMHVIKNARAILTYHVEEMNFHDALQLFSLKAFNKTQPPKDYLELSERVVNYCKGIPLALTILGSFFYDRREEDEWKSALAKLEKDPNKDIFNVLKLSFHELDDAQKNIFLDLTCFFSNSKRNLPCMHNITKYYESSAYVDLKILIEKSLISVNANGQILIHDLVVQMGQEVNQQSVKNSAKPSRLWKHEDIYRALIDNTGTETVRSISLDICKIKKIRLHPTTFRKMYDLRFLEFYKSDPQEPSKVHILEGLENLPEELRVLDWEEYPLQSLPFSFCPENLVELIMKGSHLERLWDGDQPLPNLKVIDLRDSKNLIELPDLSQTSNIEILSLDNCVSLVGLSSSCSLAKLNRLDLDSCFNLMSMEFVSMNNCEYVIWNKCPLRSLPPSILSENLVTLWLDDTNLECLWDGDQHVPNLKEIRLQRARKLIALPDLSQVPNIEGVGLSECPNLVEVYSSSFLYNLGYIALERCQRLKSLHIARDIQRITSVLVATYNYFDLRNFSFFKVSVSLSTCNQSNKPVLTMKAIPVPFTEISECTNGVDSAELQLLGETLASSLPNLTVLGWLHFPSSIGQFSQEFDDVGFSHVIYSGQSLDLWIRKSSKILEPEFKPQSSKHSQYPSIKGTTIKESSSPLEQSMGSENSSASNFPSINGLLKVPNNIHCRLSVITKLLLQRSDIISVAARVPILSGLISLALCDFRSYQPVINLSATEDSEGNVSGCAATYSNQGAWFYLRLYISPTEMMMFMSQRDWN